MQLLLIFLLMIYPTSSLLADSIVVKNFASDDNNDSFQRKHTIGYLSNLNSKPIAIDLGIHTGSWFLEELSAKRHFSIIGVSADFKSKTFGILSTEVMHNRSDTWSTETFNIAYMQPYDQKPVRFEANIERSIVDSITAINNKILVDTYTTSADFILNDAFTFVGVGIHQDFSDDNNKNGGLLKLIYTNNKFNSVRTSLVFKQLNSDNQGTGYFSPETQQLKYVNFDYSTPIISDKFLFKTSFVLGIETINNQNNNNLIKLEFGLRGWLTDLHGITGRIGCDNTGDTLGTRNNDSYRYCYAGLDYNWRLK